jgi:hypothetical protein
MDIANLSQEEKLALLEALLNDLRLEGIIPPGTLMNIASDVMLLDYQEDEELICFQCLDEQNEEE